MIYFDIEVFYELKKLLKRREKLGLIAFIGKSLETFDENDKKTLFDDFVQDEKQIIQDSYLQHAWVSVAVDLIARNIARAKYSLFVEPLSANVFIGAEGIFSDVLVAEKNFAFDAYARFDCHNTKLVINWCRVCGLNCLIYL